MDFVLLEGSVKSQMRIRESISGFVNPSIRLLVRRSVMIELESVKPVIYAPTQLSASGIGRVYGLVVFVLR